MEDRNTTNQNNEFNRIQLLHNVEKSLCKKLEIPSLRAGNITIRDEKRWRVNERYIDYCWLINIAYSFKGWCWIFSIKFNETNFRNFNNPEELIQGIFTIDKKGNIQEFFLQNRESDFQDKIKHINTFDLFDANKGITLDGVSYEYLIFAPNTQIRFTLNNPNSKNWKIWEEIVWKLGYELSSKSHSEKMKEIFK